MSPQSEILAVELVDGNKMAHYTRAGREIHPFSPWLLVEAPEECDRAGLAGVRKISHLKGGGQFRFLVHFPLLDRFSGCPWASVSRRHRPFRLQQPGQTAPDAFRKHTLSGPALQ